VFITRLRRGADVMDATSETVIQSGDIVAVAGRRDVLTGLIGTAAEEVDDRDLLAVPIEGVDVFVSSKKVDGQRLADLAGQTWARGVYLRKITRGATATTPSHVTLGARRQRQRRAGRRVHHLSPRGCRCLRGRR
jgi:putative transport protein